MRGNITTNRHVAVVMLNYNSERDLMVSAPQLAAQTHVNSTLILVDNASRADSVDQLKNWLLGWRPDSVIGTPTEVSKWVENNPVAANEPGRTYFITHHENRGYSAGNNIGARLALMIGSEAVLIVNPDVQIDNPQYVQVLADHLLSAPNAVVAASRIRNLAGDDENPMIEPGFLQELFLPIRMVFVGLGLMRRTSPATPTSALIEKVSGSCFMIRSDFLEEIGYLDEKVFLYCEESILSVQVQRACRQVIYVPVLEALHAHKTSDKGDPVRRYANWCLSRRYYHKTYTNYGIMRRVMLIISQLITLGIVSVHRHLSSRKEFPAK